MGANVPGDQGRHPVEVISVGLVDDAPAREIQNVDVAFIPITRFNLRMRADKHPRWSHLDGRHLAESSEYHDYWRRRLEILERVCIPSVLNLTPRPDAWFIGFGDAEPSYVQELLERLSVYSWIRPYLHEKRRSDRDKPIAALIGDHARMLGKPFLCSTRFDSDDSLHRQFVGALDRTISHLRERGFPDETRCLDFPYGLMQSAGELSVYLRRSNMFESIFEPADGAKGPYLGGHDEIRKLMPLIEVVTNLPMWIYHRHQDALEPPWVTARDRLPLTNPEQYFPLFGLPPDAAAFLKARSGGRAEPSNESAQHVDSDPRRQAAALRDAPHWRPEHLASAIELASSHSQPELARWLGALASGAVDAAQILREIESAPLVYLNGPLHARLLLDQGEIMDALRAYDYAVLLTPTDQNVRAARDTLAASLVSELDFDEQLGLAGIERSAAERTNAVVIVASMPTTETEPGELESLQQRAGSLAGAGFDTYVFYLPHLERTGASLTQVESADGVLYELAALPSPIPAGADALRRARQRQLARRVAELRPCLLVTDGTMAAQSAAASVGRALAIPVDFSVPDER